MRVVSGIQPTGTIHLGNYFGALENWLSLQKEYDCFFFIANQHAITLPQDPARLSKNILETAAILLSIGIDPNKCALFVQSDVPEHVELSWVLSTLAPMGHMERMIQYKEKARTGDDESANTGLFTYPILMSADILIYQATYVPVGIDQAQHLELTRVLAKKFNQRFGDILVEPKPLHTKTTKVLGIDGKTKMSKSYDNYISLIEEEKTLKQKLRAAATDPARVTRNDPGNPFICNIYSWHTLFSSLEERDWVIEGCTKAKIGCVDCKMLLFKNMNAFIAPIRERYHSLMNNPDDIRAILDEGARKASHRAQQTLAKIYDVIGFSY